MTVVLAPSVSGSRTLSGASRYEPDALQYEQCINLQGVVSRKMRNASEMKSFTSESMDGSSTFVDGSDSDSDRFSIATTRRLFSSDEADTFNMHDNSVVGEGPLQGELLNDEYSCHLAHLSNRLTGCPSNLVAIPNSGSLSINNVEEDCHSDSTKALLEVNIVVSNPHDMFLGMSRVLSKTIQISACAREFDSTQESTKEEMTYALQGRFCDGLMDVTFDVDELTTSSRQGPARQELIGAVGSLTRRISIEDFEVDVTHVLVEQEWMDIHYYVNAVFDAITSEESPHSMILRGVIKKQQAVNQSYETSIESVCKFQF